VAVLLGIYWLFKKPLAALAIRRGGFAWAFQESINKVIHRFSGCLRAFSEQ
jgi:hypothetical protein